MRAALIVAFLGIGTSARAAPTMLMVGGNAPAPARDLATASISDAAKQHGASLIKASFTSNERGAITKCLRESNPWECVRSAVPGKATDGLVVASVETSSANDGSTTVELDLQVVVPSLDSVVSDQRFCEHCTDDVLSKTAGDLAHATFRELATRLGRTIIAVKTVPRGARITLDGKTFGATDASIKTYPGPHTIGLELEGYEMENQTVEAVDGRTVDLTLTLRRVPEPNGDGHVAAPPIKIPQVDTPPGSSHVLPGIVIGGGIALVATGLVLQGIAEGPPVGEDQPTRVYSTPGLVLAGAGGVAVGVGGYLWWRASHRPTPSRPSGPAVTVDRRGGIVGWMGTF